MCVVRCESVFVGECVFVRSVCHYVFVWLTPSGSTLEVNTNTEGFKGCKVRHKALTEKWSGWPTGRRALKKQSKRQPFIPCLLLYCTH